MDNLMLRRRLMMAAQGVWTTVTATTPFSVQNALKSKMRSLVQHGKMVQDGTPTPEAPVYPTINNGTVQIVRRSGLPSGYKLLEYVGSSGAAYVLTDVYLASTDVVEAEFRNSSTTGYGALYGVFRLGDSSALYANQTYYGYDESNNKVDTDLRVNTEWHTSRHDFVNGTLTIDDTTVTFTPFEFTNTIQNAVLARYYNNSYGYIWKGYIRKFKVTRGGEVICDLLPAKNAQDEVGLYDLISGNFYTATVGTLLEGDEINDYEPVVVGDTEVLTVSGINLLNPSASNIVIGQNYQVDGNPGESRNNWRTGLIPIEGGKTYAFWGRKKSDNSISAFNRINWFDADGNNISPRPSYTVDTVTVATSPSNAAFVGLSCSCFNSSATITRETFDEFNWMFAEANAEIPYQPYTAPQTASVVNLFAVGDYADSVDVVAGTVTRRVGCKVLDGTENWVGASSQTFFSLAKSAITPSPITTSSDVVCTHLVSTSSYAETVGSAFFGVSYLNVNYNGQGGGSSSSNMAAFKAELAAQYAAGTPVIVWYPLATPTTESITPQELSTVKGVNVIHAATPVAPVSITITYRAKRAA